MSRGAPRGEHRAVAVAHDADVDVAPGHAVEVGALGGLVSPAEVLEPDNAQPELPQRVGDRVALGAKLLHLARDEYRVRLGPAAQLVTAQRP